MLGREGGGGCCRCESKKKEGGKSRDPLNPAIPLYRKRRRPCVVARLHSPPVGYNGLPGVRRGRSRSGAGRGRGGQGAATCRGCKSDLLLPFCPRPFPALTAGYFSPRKLPRALLFFAQHPVRFECVLQVGARRSPRSSS
jgi:hypothetical protein